MHPRAVAREPRARLERLDERPRPRGGLDRAGEELLGGDGGAVGLVVRVLAVDDDGALEGEAAEEAAGFGVGVPGGACE